jgi:class 3 adenylate cyclase
METKETYSFINRTLSVCIPAIYEGGGVVNQFRDAGVTALFTSRLEQGLNAAVSICEEIAKLPDTEKRYEHFSIGLCYGTVMVGMVGHNERMSLLTLSTYTGFGVFLQKKAPKYYARILAAGSYIEKIENFEKKFNHRFLGYIYIRNTNSIEKIYDIFDGDTAAVRNQKRKTRMIFEKGVALFLERKFQEARIYFIEVLKTDRYDRAAREYVLLCERYGAKTEQESDDICIERY